MCRRVRTAPATENPMRLGFAQMPELRRQGVLELAAMSQFGSSATPFAEDIARVVRRACRNRTCCAAVMSGGGGILLMQRATDLVERCGWAAKRDDGMTPRVTLLAEGRGRLRCGRGDCPLEPRGLAPARAWGAFAVAAPRVRRAQQLREAHWIPAPVCFAPSQGIPV